MRTTEAARYARWSAMVAALLAVMVAGVYASRAWQARQAEKSAPPPVPPAVQQRSAEFSFSKVEGNHTRFIVRASRATEFKEGGRSLLEDVWITAFGNSGERSDQLRTRACEYFTQTGAIICPEEVLIDLHSTGQANPHSGEDAAADPASRGVHIVTSRLSFNHQTGVATSAQPVQFRFAQGEGRAIGLRYDSQRGELHLLHDVELVLRSPAAGEPSAAEPPTREPMMASSRELVYRREERLLHLYGAAKMRQGRQELQAGQITLELDAEMRAQRLVARDHPELHNPNDRSDVSLSADELAAPLGRGGQPERVIATGHVVLNARRAGGQDQLQAAWSDLELIPDTQQPRHLRATGDVEVQSSLPDGSSRRLQTSALEVFFVSAGDSSGRGDSRIERATALPATVDWQISDQGSGRPQAESMRLTGQHLEGDFGQAGELRELRGTGGVEVQRRMGSGPAVTSTSRELLALMGPDGEWSSVDQSGEVRLKNSAGAAQGDRAHFERASDSVALAGSVIIADASSRTRSHSATFRQGASELRAEGNVATVEIVAASGDAGGVPAEPAHVSSERLVADTASGHAVYSGKARLWQGDSVIQADTIDLDRAQRTLLATGNVRAVFPQVRQTPPTGAARAGPGPAQRQFWRAEAGRLIYEEGERRARLEPGAWVHSEEGSMRADRMDLFFIPLAVSAGTASAGPASPSAHPGARTSLGTALAGQELERAAGFGAVRVESGERTGTGERADYGAAEGKFVLSGGRPTLSDRIGNSTTGRQLTFFLADDRIVVDSEEGSRTLTLHRVEK